MTELIESDLQVVCETCNKKIKLDRKIAFVFYNVSDPPVPCHTKCIRKKTDTDSPKSLAIKKCIWEQRPERYVDLKNPEKKAAVETSWRQMLTNAYRDQNPRAWRMMRRMSRRRRRWG